MIRIEVDQETCIGAGQCVLAAPGYFDQRDDDGTVIVLDSLVGDTEEVEVRDAVRRCPVRAIHLASTS